MRRSLVGLGLGIALCGCTLDTGGDEAPPPVWGVPISGGTMTVSRDGNRAIVADPDRDRVYIVDLNSERVSATIVLAPRSEPGRVIEDEAGRIHVGLRGSGELLTITGGDQQLRYVCGEPRGLAAQGELVHVACATGELVTLPAGGGDPVRLVRLERDLRDVIVRDSGLAVTTFRSAKVLQLDDQGIVVARLTPPTTNRFDFTSGVSTVPATPEVAWRAVALPDGRMAIAHQRRLGTTLRVITGGYGGQCGGGAVESALTFVGTDNSLFATAPVFGASLPVDVAVSPTNGDIAMVSAGSNNVFLMSASSTMTPDQSDCGSAPATPMPGFQNGAPTAVAYRPNGALLTFYSEAGGITIQDGGVPRGITLADRPESDMGRTLFHTTTTVGLACASCHPEARDDGGVWTFDTIGVRRTQNLSGGILSRAPYHWSADMPTLHTLMADVFTERMSGEPVTQQQEWALGNWLDRVPAPRGVVVDTNAVLRGEELFNSSETGCRSCHTGTLLTNNRMANVGTASTLKVPSLIGVGGRAPYLHDGCAATLQDRFGACGGGDNHGHTSQLSATELADLIAYLESI
jgi:DNA-binding beta-propeller fold protein YncE